MHLVSMGQDLELHSHRYCSILVQKVQIFLQKLSHAVNMFLLTVLYVHVKMH